MTPDVAPSVIFGVDPGPVESGWAILTSDYRLIAAGKGPTLSILDNLALGILRPSAVAIEVMQSTGKVNGASIYATCEMIGAIAEQCRMNSIPLYRYTRGQYVRALAGRVRKTSDAILRAALLQRFGGDGKGEPMAMLKGDSDRRSAFGVAVHYLDCQRLAGCAARKGE